MKISVNSTFSYIKFNLNYGSVLQCYALQRVLKERGHDVSLLRDYRANPKYILKRFKNIRYFKFFWKKAKAQVLLQKFIKKYISLSECAYFSYKKLKKACPDAECHIVGSDQVWHNANNFRYLTYVPEDKLKLSYAASFGSAKISEEMKEIISPYLKRFQGISVRETSGVDIVKSLGYDAEFVLDPTLLLNAEAYPTAEINRLEYCYCYFLNLTNSSDISFEKIKSYSKKNKYELLVTAPINYPMFLDENLLFPSVEEWLGLYKNARCIFTNTYHGLLFCIIFKKQFLFFEQNGGGKAENERFYSLLSLLDLKNRMISANCLDENDILEKMQEHIDYDKVYSIIKENRNIAYNFFEKFGI